MRIKKLYIYIVKTFFPLLVVSSAVALFVVVTQLLWQSMADLIGKGIDGVIFVKLLFFASMTVMPLAIILGVLVASLMTFGNLGERMELLAMKSAGIPLFKIMKPLFYTAVAIAVGLFVFQNDYMITSQVKFWQYYFSIKNKSPELAIPEGVFYKDLQNYSIYVEKKDSEAKMMYGMMIYDLTQGFQDATVVMADSGKLYSSTNGAELILELFTGESFQNLSQNNGRVQSDAERPFLREKFEYKEIRIPFDANLSMMDESILSSQFVGKNVVELKQYTDSIALEIDSLITAGRALAYKTEYMAKYSSKLPSHTDGMESSSSTSQPAPRPEPMTIDEDGYLEAGTTDGASFSEDQWAPSQVENIVQQSLPKQKKSAQPNYDMAQRFDKSGYMSQSAIYDTASSMVSNLRNDNYFTVQIMDENVNLHRKNEFEYWRKFTYPVACVVFFLIGAPLGALIRKGGMGVPFITAVLFFIVFYILESFGWKMVREGTLVNWFGMWLPNMVLFPIGVWLCLVATKDSSRLSIDSFTTWIKRFFGTETDRKVEYKEIAMEDADLDLAISDIHTLDTKVQELSHLGTMHYWEFFLHDEQYEKREQLNALVEKIVKNLVNCRDYLLVHKLADYPFLRDLSRTMRPNSKVGNILMMLFLPFGLVVYMIYAIRNKRYIRELKKVTSANEVMRGEIQRVKQIR